jgi:hypothetical protein
VPHSSVQLSALLRCCSLHALRPHCSASRHCVVGCDRPPSPSEHVTLGRDESYSLFHTVGKSECSHTSSTHPPSHRRPCSGLVSVLILSHSVSLCPPQGQWSPPEQPVLVVCASAALTFPRRALCVVCQVLFGKEAQSVEEIVERSAVSPAVVLRFVQQNFVRHLAADDSLDFTSQAAYYMAEADVLQHQSMQLTFGDVAQHRHTQPVKRVASHPSSLITPRPPLCSSPHTGA